MSENQAYLYKQPTILSSLLLGIAKLNPNKAWFEPMPA
jgi:hypothetical protein